MDKCILYFENGNRYLGNQFSHKQCKDMLKIAKYKKYYTGRKYSNWQAVYIGINKDNSVSLKEREKNGLISATEQTI